ncbi:MAG: thioredoxin [bacterium]
MSEYVKDVDTKQFDEKVVKGKGLILIDFWAPWCGPCRLASPILDEIAQEMSQSVTVYKVNVDSNGELAMKYGISGIPTFILFKNGKIVKQIVGLMSKADIVNLIRSNS